VNAGQDLGDLMNDCMNFDCNDLCCQHGADVYIEEYEVLLEKGLATADQFTGPEEDDDGTMLYRTGLGPRGCIFLNPTRGCRLHASGLKPYVCNVFPRDYEEALDAYNEGYLTCVTPEEMLEMEKSSEADREVETRSPTT
jgi:Fe-S-cluster containining protein